MIDNQASYRAIGPHIPHAGFVWDIYEEPDESDSVMPEALVALMGYTRGGTQVREATERWSSSCTALGRSELDSLQHSRTSPQSVSVKPRDSASGGLSGRWPRSAAAMGEKACI